MAIIPRHAASHLRDLLQRENYLGIKNDSRRSRQLVERIEEQIDSAIEELSDPTPGGRVVLIEMNRESGIGTFAVFLSLSPVDRVILDTNRSIEDSIRQKYTDAGWSLTFAPDREYVVMAMNFRTA